MLISLHSLAISLRSSNEHIKEQWRILFDYEITRAPFCLENSEPDIILEAEVVSSLPPSPANPPSYLTTDPPLAVFSGQEHELLLRLSDKAQIQLNLPCAASDRAGDPADARIIMTARMLDDGSFEDIITLALAPLLRRRGLFMIHAFTAAHDQEAVMFVGTSGSGKTSSGLALAAAGWQLLANDVALMRLADVPFALLSPGTVHITPTTFSLLPELKDLSTKYPRNPGYRKVHVPRLEFLPEEAVLLSAPIKAIYFPLIGEKERHGTEAVPRAIGLARLMESSMDQWDQETWEDHIGFLERLSHAASFYTLYLGSDMSNLPAFLEENLARV